MPDNSGPQERRSAQAGHKSQKVVWSVILGLLLLAIIGWAISNHRGRPLTEATPVPPPTSGSLVIAPSAPPPIAPPMTQAPNVEIKPGQPEPQVPPEIARYLEHLKRVEAYRQAMRNDIGPAIDLLKTAYGAQLGLGEDDDLLSQRKLQGGYSKYLRDWQNLIRYFQALPPPNDCKDLAATYGGAVASYVSVMSNIQVAISRGDLSALLKMRGNAQLNVDQQLKRSDKMLAAVCKRFNTEKEFDITTDADIGSMLGL